MKQICHICGKTQPAGRSATADDLLWAAKTATTPQHLGPWAGAGTANSMEFYPGTAILKTRPGWWYSYPSEKYKSQLG